MGAAGAAYGQQPGGGGGLPELGLKPSVSVHSKNPANAANWVGLHGGGAIGAIDMGIVSSNNEGDK